MDRDKALKQLRLMQAWHEDNGDGPNADYDAICYAIGVIEEMPEGEGMDTLIKGSGSRTQETERDAESTARDYTVCNDCQHSEYDAMYGDRYCHYNGKAEIVPDNHYCGYGERRTDG